MHYGRCLHLLRPTQVPPEVVGWMFLYVPSSLFWGLRHKALSRYADPPQKLGRQLGKLCNHYFSCIRERQEGTGCHGRAHSATRRRSPPTLGGFWQALPREKWAGDNGFGNPYFKLPPAFQALHPLMRRRPKSAAGLYMDDLFLLAVAAGNGQRDIRPL